MKILKTLLSSYKKTDSNKQGLVPNLDAHLTACAIGYALTEQKPFLASRLGWLETYFIGHFLEHGCLSESLMAKLWNTPGIFPATEEGFKDFHAEYISAMEKIDVLGLMECPYEKIVVEKYSPQARLCALGSLEPYYHPKPWSSALEGLKVLVIHPFEQSIREQYQNNRLKLFWDKSVLPEFELLTISPPQTICGNTQGFSSWLQALDSLKAQVVAMDFDAAIVGCGSYGLPISAFVKGQGKTCIQIGGATQILFGVRGGRWDDNPAFRSLMNDAWIRPSAEERPKNWRDAEGGCYW
jgi:hypothetical protein